MNKAVFAVLRALVFLGLIVLVVKTPRHVRAQGDCSDYDFTQPHCPSGCTNGSYQDLVFEGDGVYAEQTVQNPCGDAKRGKECVEPLAFMEIDNYSNCCSLAGDECNDTGNEPCCSGLNCEEGGCCVPEGGDCLVGGFCCGNLFCEQDDCGDYICTHGEPEGLKRSPSVLKQWFKAVGRF